MRVLMLGWEFPPVISGGLGTACAGLTHALAAQRVRVLFLLPRATEADEQPHATHDLRVRSLDASTPLLQIRPVPSRITSPYVTSDPHTSAAINHATLPATSLLRSGPGSAGSLYGHDLFHQVQRYVQRCLEIARSEPFDLVHAHDWTSFPAAVAVAGVRDRPMIAHVHSIEFDRAGDQGNPHIIQIEQRGLQAATRIIAVSQRTRAAIIEHYGIDPARIDVVHNGVDQSLPQAPVADPSLRVSRDEKLVVFVGRITRQKGPEHFVRAAKMVLEKFDRVRFVVAGSGDRFTATVELAAELGVGHKVLFAGFLDSADVRRLFDLADVYVMPSVSEPFGITPLEAVTADVPVILSRSSGVTEVLTHALTVDFDDHVDIADKILAVLRHPPLSMTLRERADMQVRALTWDDAAKRVIEIYEQLLTPTDE